jgi:acyl-CoA thioesterase I
MYKAVFIFFSLIFLTSCGSGITQNNRKDSGSWKVILALWDSLTAGYWLPQIESYPSQLEKKLIEESYNYRIINAWISGDTTAWLLSRLDWVLEWETPDLAILCIGANDAFQGKSVEEIEKNIRTIIERIQSKNIPILFAGMKAPLNLWGEYGLTYEKIFPKLAKEYDLAFIPFFLKWVALKAEYNQDDRIHPTASGYAIVVENLYEALQDNNLIDK